MFSPIFTKYVSSLVTVPGSLFSATSMNLIFVLMAISEGMVLVSKLEWAKIPSRALSSPTEEGMVPRREFFSYPKPLRVRLGYSIVEGIVPARWLPPRPRFTSISI